MIVSSGEYDRLKIGVLASYEAFVYYLHEPTRGAGPMVVAEMMASIASPAPPEPYTEPWGWRPSYCNFLEDCREGCDDHRGVGRNPHVPHPCNPVVFSDCYRTTNITAKRLGLLTTSGLGRTNFRQGFGERDCVHDKRCGLV